MTADRWHGIALGFALCAAPLASVADEPVAMRVREVATSGQSRLQEVLARHLPLARRPHRPDWVVEQSSRMDGPDGSTPDESLLLVLQEDRLDGTDMLTVRYPLVDRGALRTYAGAGFSQSVYYADRAGAPTLVSRGRRDRSLGGAAEVGAELRMNGRLALNADLRWADIDGDATLLRREDGLVAADALMLGVSVGWRFR
jgi:hypothetical protein